MLVHKLFHRAQKVIIKPDDSKIKKSKSKSDAESSAAEDISSGKCKGEIRENKNREDSGSGVESGRGDSATSKVKNIEKKKKKVKLDMHQIQIFIDGTEPYVWIYEPTPLKAWLFGLGLVIAGIAICLFPLWPRTARNYVYYLSIAAAGFLLFIIGLTIVRFIVFSIVWLLTFGKHHFWMLPNLTEDVGFFASFWPLYSYEYRGNNDEEEETETVSSTSKDGPSEKIDQLTKEDDENTTSTAAVENVSEEGKKNL